MLFHTDIARIPSGEGDQVISEDEVVPVTHAAQCGLLYRVAVLEDIARDGLAESGG